jgi:hypothetical protein
MPTPPLSDELAREALQALSEHDTQSAAALALGLNRDTFRSRVKTAQTRGLHLSEGVRGAVHNAKLSYGEAKGGWTHNYDPETGNKIGTVRWAAPDTETTGSYLTKMRDAFSDIIAAPPIIQSEHSKAGKIGFFPHSDVHIGVDVDADRAGRDYTPEIAVERLKDGFSQLHASIPPCETAIILNNGDLTHANDDRDVTVKSQHRLKVKGSHRSNLRLAVMATVWQIDMALQRSERVIYRPNRGNHDPNTPDTLSIALQLRYANEPRVTIDTSEREVWVYQRGLVFLSAWHGDKRKPEAVCSELPGLFPEQFGKSRFWYGFTGHYHGPRSGVHGSINWWQLPSVCSPDQHSADANYSDDAAMRAMMFCERSGLKHDMTVRF